ncbi:XTP/dITP diphosphatase [Phosphitispora sp. TUW77]|uniref:XTP/dITP diphosphatase n=1 Tax=Phosphitispora sp. TUW77 TaxID=3152361 RepID=UPI003AB20782
MVKKIILATGNQGKVRELREILGDNDIEILSLRDFSEIGEIVEDGSTFEENALKKAKTVAEAVGLTAVADDSGLEVDFLEGAPGVYSARFAGTGNNDLENNLKLLSLMKDVPDRQRTARFRCVIAVVTPSGETYTADGTCEGMIAREMSGDNGFGYDPLFFLPDYGKTFAQLEPEIKNRISHRGKALARIESVLAEVIERVEMEQCGLG